MTRSLHEISKVESLGMDDNTFHIGNCFAFKGGYPLKTSFFNAGKPAVEDSA